MIGAVLAAALVGAVAEGGETLWAAGFERPPHRVQGWASDGQATVHALEITDRRAHSGTSSLKLDVTLQSGRYHYWYIPTRRLPAVDGMVASGWVYVEYCDAGARPAVGFNVVFDPLPESACRVLDGPEPVPVGQWFKMSLDLGAPARAMAKEVLELDAAPAFVDRLGLMVFGGHGQRVVLYIDDLAITGRIPEDLEATNAAAVQAAAGEFAQYRAAQEQRFGEVQAALSAPLDVQAGGPGAASHARKVDQWRAALTHAARTEVLNLRGQTYLSPAGRAPVEEALWRAEQLAATRKSLAAYRSRVPLDLVTYVWPATADDRRILPMTFPLDATVRDALEIAAAPGEYEPATFAIYPHQTMNEIVVEPTDLKGPAGVIPAAAVDVRWVKCWYQAGVEVWDVRHKTLTPELLLRDDDLVRVDYTKQTQWLKARDAPKDAGRLLPITLYKEFLKQVWVTVHVPEDAKPGTYEGALRIGRRGDRAAGGIVLRLTVHPFTLPPPGLDYAIYYRGQLDQKGSIGSELKSAAQYEAEMRNLVAHGATMPTSYRSLTLPGLEEELAIRKKCGVRLDPFLSLGLSTAAPATPLGLEVLRRNAADAVARVNKLGIRTLYLYGIDEARGDRLRAERPAFEAIRQAGAKVFAACADDALGIVGDLLDLAVLADWPQAQAARDWHATGARLYNYANPQGGVEAPGRYRRNYGLVLWRAGYDGACLYAYQHAFGDIWNDFDHPQYRDHVMAYPTVDGVVDTVQWEGFREAVDDVRYVTALLAAIAAGKSAGDDRAAKAGEAQAWLDALDVEACDLDAARRTMADWIVALEAP